MVFLPINKWVNHGILGSTLLVQWTFNFQTSCQAGAQVTVPTEVGLCGAGWRRKLIIQLVTEDIWVSVAQNSLSQWLTRWWQLKYVWNFHPENWGRWTHFDEHILQMGWNHQPAKLWTFWDYMFSRKHKPFKLLSQGPGRLSEKRSVFGSVKQKQSYCFGFCFCLLIPMWYCWWFRNPKQPAGMYRIPLKNGGYLEDHPS